MNKKRIVYILFGNKPDLVLLLLPPVPPSLALSNVGQVLRLQEDAKIEKDTKRRNNFFMALI
jgi:hypothetical protein